MRIYNSGNNQVAAIAQLTNQINDLQTQIDLTAKSYKSNFTAGDISAAGIFTVSHNLGTLATSVTVFDDTGEQIYPGEITVVDINTINLDLSAYTPINGTYTVLIYG
ncbi:MAG: hypothetical protein ACRCZS_30095 [Chroococcidiopsis sp.]